MHGGLWTNTGQTLSTYLPKADDIQQKLADSLGPAVAENPQKGKDKGKARARANLIKEWACPSKKKIGRKDMAVSRKTA